MPEPKPAARRPGGVPPPPPPREFRQARARASYERLLGAALSLYAERGFHATQTPEIAERAGMSVGGLYRYFKDKHQIFTELMHRVLEANRQQQDLMIADVEAELARGDVDLRRLVANMVDWTWRAVAPAPPDLLRTFRAMAIQDAAFAELCDQYDRYERKGLARVLQKLTSRRRVPSPLAAARLLDMIVPTAAIWATLHPDESRGLKDATVELVYRYLEE